VSSYEESEMNRNIALKIQFLCVALLLGAALACGSETPTPTAPPPLAPTDTPAPAAAGVEVLETTFARDIDEDGQPINPCDDFTPDEAVHFSLTLKGRPKEGTVTGRFYRGDEFLGEANVDLSDLNSGVIFSIGENSYLHFWMNASPDAPSIISENYRIDVSYEDQPIGSYSFRVVPPPDATPSQIREATLARGADADYNPTEPATTFAPDEEIYLVGRGDLGLYTRLKAEWYVEGQLDETGTRSITAQENAADTGFYFSHAPDEGWPEGEHQAVLIMNDEEVGRYDFTIAETGLVSFEDPEGVFNLSYPADFDQIEKDRTAGYSYTFSTLDKSGTVYVYFDVLDAPLSEDAWQAFADGYTVAGMTPFGEDTVELDRQLGKPGVHALYLEVESEDGDTHGLVWVEEIESALTVAVFAAPIDQWQNRQEELWAALDSFTWSPEAVQAALGE
jgi:hypothetical protein